MEKKLSGFLKYLEQSKKSKSSIKNYKADILQFLNWKAECYPELSLSKAFRLHTNFLDDRYSRNSVNRKESSIRSFIKFAYPFEIDDNNTVQKTKKSLRFFTAFSISLTTVLLLVLLSSYIIKGFLINSGNIEVVDNLKIQNRSTGLEKLANDEKNLVISVSAPLGNSGYQRASEKEFRLVSAEDCSNTIMKPFQDSDKVIIESGQSSIKVFASDVHKDSFIYLTPYTNLKAESIFVSEQGKGYFEISLSKEAEMDVEIGWMYTNTESSISIL